MISAEAALTAQFYDLDPMQVVWHGNYPRFLELGRCALLERIGYSYVEMRDSGYLWPIVDMRLKYIRPIVLDQHMRIEATLVEYENRLRVAYTIFDAVTGDVLTKASTIQLAVLAASGETCLECPPALTERVRRLLP
ncbi:MAG: acyl-CoA thioesterase [Bacteroidota bacterium]